MFLLARYDEVIDAYLSGLGKFVAAGGDPSTVQRVASFLSVGWTPTSPIASRRPAPRRRWNFGAGRRWRRPSWPISGSATGSRVHAENDSLPSAPVASGRCGP